MSKETKSDLTGRSFGSYQIESLWQSRGPYTLYQAQDVQEGHLVFLLILETSADDEPEMAGRFQRRMETVAQLVQPGIAPVTDIGLTPQNRPYCAMRARPGRTLAELIAAAGEQEEVMSVTQALQFVHRLADALRVAHPAGIIHCDLRPDHILLKEDNLPLLVDLGITGYAEIPESMRDVLRAGTLDYASPEQIEGKALSGQSNIYSLGIILYELLAGGRPEIPGSSWDIFDTSRSVLPQGTPLEEARPDLTEETYRLVKNCLWREEWNRFETMSGLIEALNSAIVAEQEATAKRKNDRKHWWRRWFIVLALLAISGVLTFVVLGRTGGYTSASASEESHEFVAPVSPSMTTVPVKATATTTPTSTAQPTNEPTPTEELVAQVKLNGPSAGSILRVGDAIRFEWSWPSLLETGQQFQLYLRSGSEDILVGSVTSPQQDGSYGFDYDVDDIESSTGDLQWYVALVSDGSDVPIVESELQNMLILIEETTTPITSPTSTATKVTPTVTRTAAPSHTPTLTATPPCVPEPPDGWAQYTPVPGDTLSGLSARYNVSISQIQEVNCLTGTTINTRVAIWLPLPPPTDTPVPATPTATSDSQQPPSDSSSPSGPKPKPTRTPPPPP